VDVKEARNLLFQLSRVQRLAERNSAREKFPLHLRGQIVPPRNHCCPQALQDVLFLLDQGNVFLPVWIEAAALIFPSS